MKGSTYSDSSEEFVGAIFMCNRRTKKECLKRELFGLPPSYGPLVKKVKSGMILFLFEYEERKLYGVFEASSDGDVNIIPNAFSSTGRQFSAQICIQTVWSCYPLNEIEFYDALKDNYYTSKKFHFHLSLKQVHNLIVLFSSRKIEKKFSRIIERHTTKEQSGSYWQDRPVTITSNQEVPVGLIGTEQYCPLSKTTGATSVLDKCKPYFVQSLDCSEHVFNAQYSEIEGGNNSLAPFLPLAHETVYEGTVLEPYSSAATGFHGELISGQSRDYVDPYSILPQELQLSAIDPIASQLGIHAASSSSPCGLLLDDCCSPCSKSSRGNLLPISCSPYMPRGVIETSNISYARLHEDASSGNAVSEFSLYGQETEGQYEDTFTTSSRVFGTEGGMHGCMYDREGGMYEPEFPNRVNHEEHYQMTGYGSFHADQCVSRTSAFERLSFASADLVHDEHDTGISAHDLIELLGERYKRWIVPKNERAQQLRTGVNKEYCIEEGDLDKADALSTGEIFLDQSEKVEDSGKRLFPNFRRRRENCKQYINPARMEDGDSRASASQGPKRRKLIRPSFNDSSSSCVIGEDHAEIPAQEAFVGESIVQLSIQKSKNDAEVKVMSGMHEGVDHESVVRKEDLLPLESTADTQQLDIGQSPMQISNDESNKLGYMLGRGTVSENAIEKVNAGSSEHNTDVDAKHLVHEVGSKLENVAHILQASFIETDTEEPNMKARDEIRSGHLEHDDTTALRNDEQNVDAKCLTGTNIDQASKMVVDHEQYGKSVNPNDESELPKQILQTELLAEDYVELEMNATKTSCQESEVEGGLSVHDDQGQLPNVDNNDVKGETGNDVHNLQSELSVENIVEKTNTSNLDWEAKDKDEYADYGFRVVLQNQMQSSESRSMVENANGEASSTLLDQEDGVEDGQLFHDDLAASRKVLDKKLVVEYGGSAHDDADLSQAPMSILRTRSSVDCPASVSSLVTLDHEMAVDILVHDDDLVQNNLQVLQMRALTENASVETGATTALDQEPNVFGCNSVHDSRLNGVNVLQTSLAENAAEEAGMITLDQGTDDKQSCAVHENRTRLQIVLSVLKEKSMTENNVEELITETSHKEAAVEGSVSVHGGNLLGNDKQILHESLVKDTFEETNPTSFSGERTVEEDYSVHDSEASIQMKSLAENALDEHTMTILQQEAEGEAIRRFATRQ